VPNPGSHAYDNERRSLRKTLEDVGIPDSRANDAANEILQADEDTSKEMKSVETREGASRPKDIDSASP
jgi:hypothetical protein